MIGDPGFSSRDDVLGLTDAYAHGLLSADQRRHVEEQAGRSEVWRAALREAQDRAGAMRSLPVHEPSEALLAAAFDEASSQERRRSTRHRVLVLGLPSAFAAAAMVLLCMHIYFRSLVPSGYDLTVLGQTTLAAGGQGSLRVRVVSGADGKPVADTPVQLTLASADREAGRSTVLAAFKTDAHGTGSPTYTLPEWEPGEYRLRITAGGRAREAIERSITLTRPVRLMLSTDKPVYQPGQTIRVRSLALRRTDGKPLTGQKAVFTVADPKGTVIFKHRTVSGQFGISSVECPLHTEIIHGAYTIRCTIGGERGTESVRTVEVRPYVLPKFRVEVAIDEPYLRPSQAFAVAVDASYFFGKPVAGAEVALELAAEASGVLQRLSITLDDAGRGRAEFRVPDRLVGTQRDAGDATVALTATVTDSGGQSESRTVGRLVAARELRIEVLPESGTLAPNVVNRVFVFVTTPDGRPAAAARIAVSGIDRELTASELGVASFELAPGERSELTIRAIDAAGRAATRTVTLATSVAPEDFVLRTDAAVYPAGGTLRLEALGSGIEPVFVDVIRDGHTLLTETVEISDGRGSLAVDLPPEATGTLQVVAYRFGPSGVAARRSRAVVVEPADELTVAVRTDKAEYRPGDRATISLSISDSGGAPAPGALSLVAVDEAVFSVLGQPPSERTLITLDEELLRPVYVLYPWTLDRDASPSRREFDAALFSATAAERASERDAALRRLIDAGRISEHQVDVLSQPNADRLISTLLERGQISREAASMLRGGERSSAHSLSVSTWPEKVREAEQRRREGGRLVRTGWVAWGATAGLTLFVILLASVRSSVLNIVAISISLTLIVGAMLPTLGKARSSARSVSEMASIRGLGQAMEMGPVPSSRRPGSPSAPADARPRVREWFPETLLWRPEIITDESGHATIDVDLADSITSWRLFGGAVTRDGRLGSIDGGLRVFQPFFVDINAPLTLTRLDEVSIPLVIYNYLDAPQTVRIRVNPADWFELQDGEAERVIDLPAGAVRSLSLGLRALRAGAHVLEVSAIGSGDDGASTRAADAIRRTIEVLPGGRTIEKVVSGSLATPLSTTVQVDPRTIDGSGRLFVKVYPSPLSQFVEGLEGIFQAPHGCFEQTSSTTYPNVLALDYLRRSGKSVPGVELTARQYIHLGYQRLLTFEIDGGGFDWFGRPPANRLLTAYGLMQFKDMARVHDVDPALIHRTRSWLLRQRSTDGSWTAESRGPNAATRAASAADRTLMTTAYIAWAVFAGSDAADAAPTRDFLRAVRPAEHDDPYTLALMAHALAAVGADPRPWLDRLVEQRRQSPDGRLAWWERPAGARTAFYGAGASGDVEATALATLALLEHRGDPTAARAALAWLISNRDSRGTWGTTQATVLSLRALVAAADSPLGEPVERQMSIELDGRDVRSLAVHPDQAEVLQLIDLSSLLEPGATHHLRVSQTRGPAAHAQLVFRAALPHEPGEPVEADGPLAVSVSYDRDALRVGEELRAVATLTTSGGAVLPMVMLDLPVPPGFEPSREDFDRMVSRGDIARYEVTPRGMIVYLLALRPGEGLTLRYSMRATMPVVASVEAPAAYEYYNPASRARGEPATVRVRPMED